MAWEVLEFEIKTALADTTTGALYANGNMQLEVNVYIKAIDAEQKAVQLSDDQLKTIKLVDGKRPDNDLPTAWKYSTSENEWRHVLPGARLMDKRPQAGEPQVQTYWLTATEERSQEIAASIKDGNGHTTTTVTEGYHSSITVVAHRRVDYTDSNCLIEKQIPGDSGKFSWKKPKKDHWDDWNYKNYYLSIDETKKPGHVIEKIEREGFAQHPSSLPNWKKQLDNCCYWGAKWTYWSLFFLWPYGERTQTEAGYYQDQPELKIYGARDVIYNNKANAVTMSHIKYEEIGGEVNPRCPISFDKTSFTIFDQFGNSGAFRITYSETLGSMDIVPDR